MYLKIFCLWLFIFLQTERSFVIGATKQVEEREILKKILHPDIYDKSERPFSPNSTDGNGPTAVTVNLYIRHLDIDDVDAINKEYTIQATFRQEWLDQRLKFNNTVNGLNETNFPYATLLDPSQIWIPDLFFSNERAANLHDLMKPNLFLRIFPNGTVCYSARITLKLGCFFDFNRFPFDRQMCNLRMASYAFTKDDITLHWKADNPVQVTSDLQQNHFQLHTFESNNCYGLTRTGIYSCLRVDFFFKRELRKWIENVYIPSAIIVAVAWFGCWLDERLVMARMIIGLSSLFVLMTEVSKLNDSVIPQLAHSTAISSWTDTCIAFVFASLVEFMLVTCIARITGSGSSNNNKREDEETLINRFEIEDGQRQQEPLQRMNFMYRVGKGFLKLTISQKVDFLFRIIYPIAFLFFLCLYKVHWSEDCTGVQPSESC